MSQNDAPFIGAVIAAAGRSRRMGQPKQLMPWGELTILGTVIEHLRLAGAEPVLCVIGHMADEMVDGLADIRSRSGVEFLVNPDYLEGEMLSSYQAGVRYLSEMNKAFVGTLLALGDQPQVPVEVVAALLTQASKTPEQIVMPRFEGRRGHPFYFPRRLWSPLLALGHEETLRTIIRGADHNGENEQIAYVDVSTDAILRDIDTPQDYNRLTAKRSHDTDDSN